MTNKTLLGEIITWEIFSGHVLVKDLRDGIDAESLGDPEMLVPDMKTRSGFNRAVKELKEDRLIEEVAKEKGEVRFQLTQESNDGTRITHVYEAMFLLDTETGVVTCPENPKLAQEASDLVQRQLELRNSADINRLVQKLFRENADLFSINPRKGTAYFVPFEHRDFVERIERFMRFCGGLLHRWPVPSGDSKGNQSVRYAVSSGLERMVKELEEAAEAWDETTRGKTVESVMENYEEISIKAQAYAEYLEDRQGELLEKIKQSKRRLCQKAAAIGHEQPPENQEEPAEA